MARRVTCWNCHVSRVIADVAQFGGADLTLRLESKRLGVLYAACIITNRRRNRPVFQQVLDGTLWQSSIRRLGLLAVWTLLGPGCCRFQRRIQHLLGVVAWDVRAVVIVDVVVGRGAVTLSLIIIFALIFVTISIVVFTVVVLVPIRSFRAVGIFTVAQLLKVWKELVLVPTDPGVVKDFEHFYPFARLQLQQPVDEVLVLRRHP